MPISGITKEMNHTYHPELARAIILYENSLPPKSQGVRYARMFVEDAADPSKDSLDAFMDRIRLKYKDSSVKYIFQCIRRMYNLAQLPWPYRSSDVPVIRERTVFAPVLDEAVIAEMIEAAKTKLTARMAFYVAISTTYGCRRIELAQIDRTAIDLKNRLIYIETKKSGRERFHVIPDEIFPCIQAGYKVVKPMNTKTMDRMWHRIENAIKFPHVKDVGWHSIRRALDKSLLEAGLPVTTVMDFLRWKRSEHNMPVRYSVGTVIGRNTSDQDLGMKDRAVDEAIFRVHPYLKYW